MTNDSAARSSGFLTYSHTIGIANMVGRGFYFPADTAVGTNGRLYTVNRGLDADTRGVRVTAYNLASDFFETFGSFGRGDGQFISPTSIAVDGIGQVYVSDENTHRITIFDGEGTFLAVWGVHGDRLGELDGPSGIAFDSDDNLYVADHRNHRIQRFTSDGRFQFGFGSAGSEEGQLSLPWGVTVGANGDVYVADWGNDLIKRFSPDGEFVGQYGSLGRADGQLKRPSSVAADAEGYIYVADWGNERVQVFDPEGDFVMKLRGSATVSKWAGEFLSTNVEEAEARAAADMEPDVAQFGGDPHEESSHIERYFWAPVSVKLDDEGRVYVTESNRHRVQIFERG